MRPSSWKRPIPDTLPSDVRPLLSATIRIEDILTIGAVLLAGPLIFGSGGDHFSAATNVGALVGVLYLGATAGAIIVLATRNPGDQPPLSPTDGNLNPRAYAPFPFIAALGMVGSAGADGVGLGSADILFAPIFVTAVAGFMFYEKLPVLPAKTRRALVTPCILICAAIFNGIMADMFAEVRPADIAGIVDAAGLGVAAMLFFFVPGVFYVMFVFAPRQLAESEGTWTQWITRYALYLAAAIPGAALLSAF